MFDEFLIVFHDTWCWQQAKETNLLLDYAPAAVLFQSIRESFCSAYLHSLLLPRFEELALSFHLLKLLWYL